MKTLILFLGLLLMSVSMSCGGKAKDATGKSVEKIKDNSDDSIANNKEEADFLKENIEDINEEFVEDTKVLDLAPKDGKESIDLSAKNSEEVVKSPIQKTENVVRDAEEKTKNVDIAIKKTEKILEKPSQVAVDVLPDVTEKPKDVAFDNANQPIEGIWDIGTENTKIEILQNNNGWVGKIKSSDNEKAPIGKVILKDLKKQNEKWKGKLFIVKKQKWTDVEMIPYGSKLDLLVSTGFSSKKVQWSKANN